MYTIVVVFIYLHVATDGGARAEEGSAEEQREGAGAQRRNPAAEQGGAGAKGQLRLRAPQLGRRGGAAAIAHVQQAAQAGE